MIRFPLLIGIFLALVAPGFSYECEDTLIYNRDQFYIGPEWSRVTRKKEGGTRQDGDVWGVRFGYDRLKYWCWYWGGDFVYATGPLKGHSGNRTKIHSRLRDLSLEGRFGFTFQETGGWGISFTPYVALGYAKERIIFVNPSPIHVHFNTHFPYVAGGFLSSIYPTDWLEVGLNFKAKYPYEPKCEVSHDSENPRVNQKIDPKFHYRVELPLTLRILCGNNFAWSFIPFYDYRNYGGHPNYPFNFIDTTLSSWGLTLELQYWL